ncbi:unnamed protein product, partial [Allacma fusca]
MNRRPQSQPPQYQPPQQQHTATPPNISDQEEREESAFTLEQTLQWCDFDNRAACENIGKDVSNKNLSIAAILDPPRREGQAVRRVYNFDALDHSMGFDGVEITVPTPTENTELQDHIKWSLECNDDRIKSTEDMQLRIRSLEKELSDTREDIKDVYKRLSTQIERGFLYFREAMIKDTRTIKNLFHESYKQTQHINHVALSGMRLGLAATDEMAEIRPMCEDLLDAAADTYEVLQPMIRRFNEISPVPLFTSNGIPNPPPTTPQPQITNPTIPAIMYPQPPPVYNNTIPSNATTSNVTSNVIPTATNVSTPNNVNTVNNVVDLTQDQTPPGIEILKESGRLAQTKEVMESMINNSGLIYKKSNGEEQIVEFQLGTNHLMKTPDANPRQRQLSYDLDIAEKNNYKLKSKNIFDNRHRLTNTNLFEVISFVLKFEQQMCNKGASNSQYIEFFNELLISEAAINWKDSLKRSFAFYYNHRTSFILTMWNQQQHECAKAHFRTINLATDSTKSWALDFLKWYTILGDTNMTDDDLISTLHSVVPNNMQHHFGLEITCNRVAFEKRIRDLTIRQLPTSLRQPNSLLYQSTPILPVKKNKKFNKFGKGLQSNSKPNQNTTGASNQSAAGNSGAQPFRTQVN